MDIGERLHERSGGKCELCSGSQGLSVLEISPPIDSRTGADASVLVCEVCRAKSTGSVSAEDQKHWACLQESMWSEHEPVKVLCYRILYQFRKNAWATELLEQLFLDDELVQWAIAGVSEEDERKKESQDLTQVTTDSNGTPLSDGDSVTLIKDLDVKGGGFTAKRGTLVKNISLSSNPEHVEGRVNGVHIVLVAKFLKKVV